MGARRRTYKQRFASLSLEILEDRCLLSAIGITSDADHVVAPVLTHPASHLPNQAPPAAGNPQGRTDAPGGLDLPPHALMDLPDEGPDRDGDVHVVDRVIALSLNQPASSPLAPTWLASAGVPTMPIAMMSLPSNLDLFATAGLSAAEVGAVTPLLPVSAKLPMGESGQPADEGAETFPIPPAAEGETPQFPPSNPESEQPAAEASPGDPIADLLPVDVESIQRSADAFFEQLGRLSDEWNDGRSMQRLTPWILIMGTASYEGIRLWRLRKARGKLRPSRSPDPTVILAGDVE